MSEHEFPAAVYPILLIAEGRYKFRDVLAAVNELENQDNLFSAILFCLHREPALVGFQPYVSTAPKLVDRIFVLTRDGSATLNLWRIRNAEQPAKRTGRPRKGETDKGAVVIAALARHHEYESGGSIGNYEPANLTALANAHKGDLSKAAFTRFLESKFGKPAYKRYTVVCQKREIGRFLALWQGDVSEGHFDLRPDEYGRRE